MIVVSGDYGQLGNRLIVYANLIAGARQHGLRLANPAFHEYAPYFETTRGDVWCRFPATGRSWFTGPRLRRWVHRGTFRAPRLAKKFRNRTGRWPPWVRVLDVGWHQPCNVDGPEFLALARRPGFLIAKGWLFRAYASFAQHADALRRFFTPIEIHRRKVAALLARLRHTADVVVGVHVRQGDYRAFCGGRFFYDTRQYANVLQGVTGLFAGQTVAFLLCSDTAQPAAAFAGLNVMFGTHHVVEDLYALAACDYLIGPPSTFSQWASFYGAVPRYVLVDPDARANRGDFAVTHNFNAAAEEVSPVSAGV
jgi:hypothetical protein